MEVEYGKETYIESWMELVRKVRWNFPGLETEDSVKDYENTVLITEGEPELLSLKTGTTIEQEMNRR